MEETIVLIISIDYQLFNWLKYELYFSLLIIRLKAFEKTITLSPICKLFKSFSKAITLMIWLFPEMTVTT